MKIDHLQGFGFPVNTILQITIISSINGGTQACPNTYLSGTKHASVARGYLHLKRTHLLERCEKHVQSRHNIFLSWLIRISLFFQSYETIFSFIKQTIFSFIKHVETNWMYRAISGMHPDRSLSAFPHNTVCPQFLQLPVAKWPHILGEAYIIRVSSYRTAQNYRIIGHFSPKYRTNIGHFPPKYRTK